MLVLAAWLGSVGRREEREGRRERDTGKGTGLVSTMGAGRLWKGQTGLPDGAVDSRGWDGMTLRPKDFPVLLCAKQLLLILGTRVPNEILLTGGFSGEATAAVYV